jgi:hypothetical protein
MSSFDKDDTAMVGPGKALPAVPKHILHSIKPRRRLPPFRHDSWGREAAPRRSMTLTFLAHDHFRACSLDAVIATI